MKSFHTILVISQRNTRDYKPSGEETVLVGRQVHVQNKTGRGLSLSTVPTKIHHFGIRIQLLNGTWTYAMGVVINGWFE